MQINLEKKKSSAACRTVPFHGVPRHSPCKNARHFKTFSAAYFGYIFCFITRVCFSQLHPTTLLPTNQKTTKNYLIYISNVQQSYHLFLCTLLLSLSICYYSQFKALIADHLTTHLISQAFQFEFHFLFLTFL